MCLAAKRLVLTDLEDAEGYLAISGAPAQRSARERPYHDGRHDVLLPILAYSGAQSNSYLSSLSKLYMQFPLMFVSPQRIRWLFVLKAIIVPPTWLAMLIWAFVKVRTLLSRTDTLESEFFVTLRSRPLPMPASLQTMPACTARHSPGHGFLLSTPRLVYTPRSQ